MRFKILNFLHQVSLLRHLRNISDVVGGINLCFHKRLFTIRRFVSTFIIYQILICHEGSLNKLNLFLFVNCLFVIFFSLVSDE
jgi:hypothetical protein